jgi:CheY-like chemotaxis protein
MTCVSRASSPCSGAGARSPHGQDARDTHSMGEDAHATVPIGKTSAASAGSDAHATILVVDDEPELAKFIAIALEGLHFRVEVAFDGVEALEKLRWLPGIRLVVLDLSMPRMGGLEFLKRLRHFPWHPDVVVSTGYKLNLRPTDLAKYRIKGILNKPYTMDELAAAVSEAMA